ncbi:hypothetical protein EPUL_004488 [Erysiphe pulchra]|uniref:HlyIII-domain-containing protein n=1 Tax=Erysiphe pulchra TaxID=225359 RepID=A0A2S4PKU3_9PEZI|nr:hypothetical protein EPUL_004488 [Erysiphe pulchra]
MEKDSSKSIAVTTADTNSKTTATTSVKSSSLTVTWEELPAWQQDNHYIRTGYRPASASFLKSFSSLGYLHNESVNIYSHLLGAIFFAILGSLIYYFMIILHSSSSHYSSYYGMMMKAKKAFSASTAYGSGDVTDTAITLATLASSPEEVKVFSCFFAGAISCLAISGTYHSISNHSPTVARWGNKMDYVGIICLIARWPERSKPGFFDIWGSSHQIFHILVLVAAGFHFYSLLTAFKYHHHGTGATCVL